MRTARFVTVQGFASSTNTYETHVMEAAQSLPTHTNNYNRAEPKILINARNVGLTPRAAAQQILRAQGNIGGLQGRVTILTKGGTVTF